MYLLVHNFIVRVCVCVSIYKIRAREEHVRVCPRGRNTHLSNVCTHTQCCAYATRRTMAKSTSVANAQNVRRRHFLRARDSRVPRAPRSRDGCVRSEQPPPSWSSSSSRPGWTYGSLSPGTCVRVCVCVVPSSSHFFAMLATNRCVCPLEVYACNNVQTWAHAPHRAKEWNRDRTHIASHTTKGRFFIRWSK